MSNIFLPLLGGAAAGLVNGFIGTGGGIILVFILSRVMGSDKTKDTFATVIDAILPMSAVSAFTYYTAGNLPLGEAAVYIAPAAIGGVIGAFLLDKISTKWLKVIFSVLVIYAGYRMLVK